jgi:hypothetical protein
MAMKVCFRALLGSMVFLAVGATAQAQYPGARPTVTPWLNLYRAGNPAALNYYNLVRPELDFRSSIAQLQLQTGANQQGIADLASAPAGPVVTGHAAGFMTHNGYFQTQSGGGSAGGGFGTANRGRTGR